METSAHVKVDADRQVWFSMWFLSAIITFGLAFFPMFHRLIDGSNRHFRREAELEKQISVFLKNQGKKPPAVSEGFKEMNANLWTASIILVVPSFIIMYLLSRDLALHERRQERFLADAFSEKMFMTQTIPIKTYVLLTIFTLGVGGIYWLYKVVNLYNAHFKAQLQVEKQVGKLMEEAKVVGNM